MNGQLQTFIYKYPHEEGFTIVELIIVIIIISVVSAIALPSFLNCGVKSRSTEARIMVGAMNRAQQAYFLENKGKFAKSIPDLDIGITSETKNYKYSANVTAEAVFNYGIAKQEYVDVGWFNKQPLQSYVGAVFMVPNAKKSSAESQTVAVLCQSKFPTTQPPAKPSYQNGIPTCASDLHQFR